MKKIYTLTTILIFLININFGFSQDNMPETRIDDPKVNIDVAKAIKFYCKDYEIATAEPKLFKKAPTTKGEYLRHTFTSAWIYASGDNGIKKNRDAYVHVAIKTEQGCEIIVLYVRQYYNIGNGNYDQTNIRSCASANCSYDAFKKNVDCESIMKIKDWLAE